MGPTIAGIDISRSSISVCILAEIPRDMKSFKRKFKPLTFPVDRAGIDALLALEFDAAVMEPTGGHYSKIWAHHLTQADRTIRWIGHRELKSYREGWRLFNKSDKLDCIALACYGLERWNRAECFIAGTSHELRELCLQLESINRMRTPVINRLRLQLAHECPELAQRSFKRTWNSQTVSYWVRAVAGEPVTERWQTILKETIGTGISPFSQRLAQQILAIETQEYEIEVQLHELMQNPEFKPYLEIFERYEIRERTAAVLLGAIYPFSKFLENGRPIIERIDGKKRYRSLASFKLALGLGMIQLQSGEFEKWQAGGRADVRQTLWRWCKVAIVMQPRLENPNIATLRHYYDYGTEAEVNGKLKQLDPGVSNQRIMRVVRRMLTMLFRELVQMQISE